MCVEIIDYAQNTGHTDNRSSHLAVTNRETWEGKKHASQLCMQFTLHSAEEKARTAGGEGCMDNARPVPGRADISKWLDSLNYTDLL